MNKPHSFSIIAEDGTVAKEIPLDNIPEEFEGRYWAPKGQEAFRDYLKRHVTAGSNREGVSQAGGDSDASVVDLIQFNIESVQGFYCDNLGSLLGSGEGQQKAPERSREPGSAHRSIQEKSSRLRLDHRTARLDLP